MTHPFYDFCVAAGEPSVRDATGGGQHWVGCTLHTCRLDADGSAIRVVSTTRLPATAPGYLTVARTRSGQQMLYAISGEEISWYSIGDDGKVELCGSTPIGSDSAAHLCTDHSTRLLFMANYGSSGVGLPTDRPPLLPAIAPPQQGGDFAA